MSNLISSEMSLKYREKMAKLPPPLTAEDSPKYLKALLYGDLGTGKTVAACRLDGATAILAADPGWVSVYNHPKELTDITPLPYQGFGHLETLAEAFFFQEPPYDQYDNFIVDTASAIQEDYLDALIRGAKPPKETRIEFTVTDRRVIDPPILPGMDDYHAVRNILRPTIMRLMQAPVNVILLAHEREPSEFQSAQTKKKSKYRIRPNLTETLFLSTARPMHLIGYTERNGDKYTIDFATDSDVVSKSRLWNLNGKKIPGQAFGDAIRQWKNKPRPPE